MRLISTFCFICILAIPLLAQNTAQIQSLAEEYIQAMQQKDWEKVTNNTYPGIFDYITREQFISLLEMMDNPSMTTEFSEMKITSISDPYFSGTGQYAMINYSMNMRILLKGDEWTQQVIDQTVETLTTEYGDAQYDPMARMIVSKGNIYLFAIKDQKTVGNWKFAENSKSLREILGKSIPQDVFSFFTP